MSEETKPIELPEAMKRYCVKCCTEIDPKRVTRGSFFCGLNKDRCRLEDRKARRAYKASRDCALCGRKARQAKPKQTPESAVAPGARAGTEQVQTADSPIASPTMTEVLLEQSNEVNQ